MYIVHFWKKNILAVLNLFENVDDLRKVITVCLSLSNVRGSEVQEYTRNTVFLFACWLGSMWWGRFPEIQITLWNFGSFGVFKFVQTQL